MRPKGPPKGPWDDEGNFWTKLARDQNQSFTTSSDYYAHEGMGCFLQLIFYCILGFMFYVFISWASGGFDGFNKPEQRCAEYTVDYSVNEGGKAICTRYEIKDSNYKSKNDWGFCKRPYASDYTYDSMGPYEKGLHPDFYCWDKKFIDNPRTITIDPSKNIDPSKKCIKRVKYSDGTYVNYGIHPDEYCPED